VRGWYTVGRLSFIILGMSEPILKVRVDAPSGTIVLNRPNRRNALSRAMIAEFRQALTDLHQEQKVRAIIVTGAGTTFCAGLDLHEMSETTETASEMDQAQQWHEDAIAFRDLLKSLLEFPKPIIAAVNGPAFGGGAGLVCAADLVVASSKATVAIPGPRRGLVAGVVAPLLAFRVGGGWAANLMLTSRTMEAEEARSVGVFHELVEEDVVWVRAHELAGQVAGGAQEAIAMTKRMLNETIGESLSTMLSAGAAMTATSKTTEAAREGVRAFIEKREPEWP